MTRCPVCRRAVLPTIYDRVARHHDTIGHNCPASGKPWRITREVSA